ncbi:MAG TPA: M23 family metallopeptidase, partial [Candidatus Paceibacterota bacterium]|nr:M23 family metallopeptidase [Candidatus Paceibacterota bacterium]
APIGTPIHAAASGVVIIARSGGYNGGYGSYVVISHPNGTQTLYAHMSKVIAHQGDAVEQGDLIGLVGSTGKSTGPHVHFEVRGAVNPF